MHGQKTRAQSCGNTQLQYCCSMLGKGRLGVCLYTSSRLRWVRQTQQNSTQQHSRQPPRTHPGWQSTLQQSPRLL